MTFYETLFSGDFTIPRGQADGRTDERTNGRTDGRTEERMNGRTNERMDGPS